MFMLKAAGYAGGLDRVPRDEMDVKVHKDEAILQVAEAARWRRSRRKGGPSTGSDKQARQAVDNTEENLKKHLHTVKGITEDHKKKSEDSDSRFLSRKEKDIQDHREREEKRRSRFYNQDQDITSKHQTNLNRTIEGKTNKRAEIFVRV